MEKGAIWHDGQHFIQMGVNSWQAVSQFHSDNWKKVGLIAGGTALLFLVDKDMQRFARLQKLNEAIGIRFV